MKKNIILGITFILLSLQQVAAQNNVQVSERVSARFDESFADAKNVRWKSLPKQISQAQFYYNGASWLAYFDEKGTIITSGRRIKDEHELPLQVQTGLNRAKNRIEKKGSSAEVVLMYEMVQDDATRYFVSMQNENTISSFFISQNGNATLQAEKARAHTPIAPKDVIAKKN